MSRPAHTFYEFFAGGGMARLGLGARWRCAFANDFDPVKAAAYRANFPDAADHLREADVWTLSPDDLPLRADLAWASSPCQDFSLAGGRAGLSGGRSSAFFGFWRLIEALGDRRPRLVVIENVTGLLTSRGGADFAGLAEALAASGYRFGALEVDAAAFLPQSRPRVFVVAVRGAVAPGLAGDSPFHTRAAPPRRNTDLAALLEPDASVAWHDAARTERLLSLMAPLHRSRIEARRGRAVGTVFRRTRVEGGHSVQRAEVRFDGVAGCLRTPRGGSSRQVILVVDGGRVRSRLLTPREAGRLMGLPEGYRLPQPATAALHVAGDGVAVPVVRWLASELLEPLLEGGAMLAAE
jgi:DNA (cytosine-5)-methyltransferase 1